MRKKIVAGNWKMNLDRDESKQLFSNIISIKSSDNGPLALVFPPSIYLADFVKLNNGNVSIGAQNFHHADKGAFTGEVSAGQLKSIGCEYVLVGHSERRTLFMEDDQVLLLKIRAALENELQVIYCCGESLEEREQGQFINKIRSQVNLLKTFSTEEMNSISIAYEPIWAIGTGKTASPKQAAEMHDLIREEINVLFGAETSENTSILYGGSCSPKNAHELFMCKNIDGGLIGGASLDARSFHSIISACQ
tara:strand:- start:543 stop:1292 length:750 start_codon:yes stop_codon:yes gene_type:complete